MQGLSTECFSNEKADGNSDDCLDNVVKHPLAVFHFNALLDDLLVVVAEADVVKLVCHIKCLLCVDVNVITHKTNFVKTDKKGGGNMDLFTLVGKIAVDASEATNNIQIVIDKVNELNIALNGSESESKESGKAISESFEEATQKTGSTMSKWNVFLGNMATQAANAALRMGKSFFQTGFEFNQNMEKWTASFKTYMGGDLEAASAFMEEVRQFAIETPLSLSDSVQSAVKLMASGFESGEVIDTLRMLGDIANGDTEKMSRLALVLSQVMSAKKLKGNDPNQFKEAGVPIYDLLLDYYHANGYDYIDEAFLQEMQRKGGITSDEVLGALKMATSEGGMYYNAMNNIMDTEYGQAQKMMDSYEQAAGSFTKAIFEVFQSDTIPALNEILQQLNEWATKNPDALTKLSEAFSTLATGGVDVLLGSLQGLLTFWNENQDMFNAMLLLFGGLAIKSGHPAAGMALITAGGYNVWDDWVKENQKELSALTSDVDLPFIKQQLEYQGKADAWEAYLANWKQERMDEGYSEDDVNAFVEKQFADYKQLPGYHIGELTGLEGQDVPERPRDPASEMSWLERTKEEGKMLAAFWKSLWAGDLPSNAEELESWERKYGLVDDETEDEDSAEPTDSRVTERQDYWNRIMTGHPEGIIPDDDDSDGTSGSRSIGGVLASIQSTLASLPSEVQAAASAGVTEGVSGIAVTGTITTGDITLDTGALVGQLAPKLDLRLGAADARATRGVV